MDSLHHLFAALLGPWGLVVLAALDSSAVFFLPLALDAAVVALVARQPELFWLFPLVATAGSTLGGALTFWLGRRLGAEGLDRLVSKRRLDAARERVEERGAVALALPALVPPPFPFTAFLLAGGALEVRPAPFLLTLAGARLFRFGLEAILARRYGDAISAFLQSDVTRWAVGILIMICFAGTAWAVARVYGRGR